MIHVLSHVICAIFRFANNALNIAYRSVFAKVEIWNHSFKIERATLRTTAPILGFFALILMHFHTGCKYGNEN